MYCKESYLLISTTFCRRRYKHIVRRPRRLRASSRQQRLRLFTDLKKVVLCDDTTSEIGLGLIKRKVADDALCYGFPALSLPLRGEWMTSSTFLHTMSSVICPSTTALPLPVAAERNIFRWKRIISANDTRVIVLQGDLLKESKALKISVYNNPLCS